jgi:hypothetical protein
MTFRSLAEGATILLAVLATAACSASEPEVTWEGTVDTLPGGSVRIVNPAVGLWEVGIETPWRLVPELTLGALEGDRPDVFSTIAGLAVDAHGRILVVDRDTNELRMFGPDGRHLRTTGRSGQGPGEYVQANGLIRLPSDSLLVIDQQGNRYSILTSKGEYVRSVRRDLGFFGWLFEGGVSDGYVYEKTLIQLAGDAEAARRPAFLGTSLRDVDVALDTVLLPELSGPYYQSFSIRTDRGGMVMPVPFTSEPVYALDSEELWFGHGNEFRLLLASLAGDTLREIVLDATPAPVSQAELDEWLASDWVEDFRQRGGKIDMERIPATKPYFDGLHTDPDGYLWVSTPTVPGRIEFAVFDPGGRYLGRLGLDGFDRAMVAPVVAAGRLHVVTSDELGVQRVLVLRVERDLEPLEASTDLKTQRT